MENEQSITAALPADDQKFQVPLAEVNSEESDDSNLERFKIKVEIVKWLIGTVGLTLVTYFINWGFKDRENGMLEISQYDKYATELIVLNDNPIKRRMLAQFFASVTPSQQLKDGWANYYKEVNKEYITFLKSDSLYRIRSLALAKIDSVKLTPSQKTEKNYLEQKLEQNNEMINAPLVIPENSAITQATVYIQSVSTPKKDVEEIRTLLMNSGFRVPPVEYMDKVKYAINNNQIRYFRDEDSRAIEQLRMILESDNVKSETKFFPVLNKNTKQGVIELWLK